MEEILKTTYIIENFEDKTKNLLSATNNLIDELSSYANLIDPHYEFLLTLHNKLLGWSAIIKNEDNVAEFISQVRAISTAIRNNITALSNTNDKMFHKAITNTLSSINLWESSAIAETAKSYGLFFRISGLLQAHAGINFIDIKEQFNSLNEDISAKRSIVAEGISNLENNLSALEEYKNAALNQISNASGAVATAATKQIGSTIGLAFKLNADKEEKQAVLFRRGALTCFAISAGIILYHLCSNTTPPLFFSELFFRAGPVLFFTIPAFYLARESAAHRAAHRRFQHLSLNLPIGIKYIRGLDEKTRHLIEAEFAKHLLMYAETPLKNNENDAIGNKDDMSKFSSMLSDIKTLIEKK